MGFGDELWDGFDICRKGNQASSELLVKYATWFKKYSAVEKQYGNSLVKLGRKVVAKPHRLPGREQGTLKLACDGIHAEIEKMGMQHLEFAQSIQTTVLGPLNEALRDGLRREKEFSKQGSRVLKTLDEAIQRSQKQKSKYDKLQKDLRNLRMRNEKVPAPELQEKIDKLVDKSMSYEDNYRTAEQQASSLQEATYTLDLPNVLNEMQAEEEGRVDTLEQALRGFSTIQAGFVPAQKTMCSVFEQALDSISVLDEIRAFVAAFSSGASPPVNGDAPMPVAGGSNRSSRRLSLGNRSSSRHSSMALSPGSSRQTGPPAYDDCSAYAGNERRRRIAELYHAVMRALDVELNTKRGLENMVQMYQSQPDQLKTAQRELDQCLATIAELEDQKLKYENISHQLGPDDPNEATSANPEEFDEDPIVDINPVQMRALYAFADPEENELGFEAGDILTISSTGNCGWWRAQRADGAIGMVPSNYLEELE